MKNTFNYVLYALFFVIFIGIAAIGFVAHQNGTAFVKTSEEIEVTDKILAETGILDALDDENETDVRNYLLTGDSALLNNSRRSEKAMLGHLAAFKILVPQNESQNKKVALLELNIHKKFHLFDSAVGLRQNEHQNAAMGLLTSEDEQGVITETGHIITDIESAQRNYLNEQREISTKTMSGLNRIFWFLLFVPVVLLGTSLYAIRYTLIARKRTEDEIRQLNAGLEARVSERTEELRSLNESLEKRVAERTAELEETNKNLESFSYTVSHDLRAPLRVINSYAQILLKKEKDKLGNDERQLLDDITNIARHSGQLVDDLLKFSKLGRAPLVKSQIDMNGEMKMAVDEVRKSLNGDCKAKIVMHEVQSTSCDPMLIRQVWSNLVSNAIKYSQKKDVPLAEIGTEEADGTLAYYVKDNGAGFDMKYADKLFGVFQRLHKNSEYEGTGVGLALVHKIVTKHGGRIWAKSQIDQGATFYFTLS